MRLNQLPSLVGREPVDRTINEDSTFSNMTTSLLVFMNNCRSDIFLTLFKKMSFKVHYVTYTCNNSAANKL